MDTHTASHYNEHKTSLSLTHIYVCVWEREREVLYKLKTENI